MGLEPKRKTLLVVVLAFLIPAGVPAPQAAANPAEDLVWCLIDPVDEDAPESQEDCVDAFLAEVLTCFQILMNPVDCLLGTDLGDVLDDAIACVGDPVEDDVGECPVNVEDVVNLVCGLVGGCPPPLVDDLVACLDEVHDAVGECPVNVGELVDFVCGEIGGCPPPVPGLCDPPATVGVDDFCLSTDPCDTYPDEPCPPDPPGVCDPPQTVGVDDFCVSTDPCDHYPDDPCPPATPETCDPPQSIGLDPRCIWVPGQVGIVMEENEDFQEMMLEPPNEEELASLIQALSAPLCLGVPALRVHSTDGLVPALKMDCDAEPLIPGELLMGGDAPDEAAEGPAASWQNGQCSIPSSSSTTLTTPIWYTVFYDAAINDPVHRATWINSHFQWLFSGRTHHGIKQAEIPLCLNYILPVPTWLEGTVQNTHHLDLLRAWEGGFSDGGQFVVVLGHGKIRDENTHDWINGVTAGSTLGGANPVGMYYHHWAKSNVVGQRLATHELGHVFGSPGEPHTPCVPGGTGHDFFHPMGFSSDRHGTCTKTLYLTHRHMNTFYAEDVTTFGGVHAAWCAARKGSPC